MPRRKSSPVHSFDQRNHEEVETVLLLNKELCRKASALEGTVSVTDSPLRTSYDPRIYGPATMDVFKKSKSVDPRINLTRLVLIYYL
jgi:hypothetical protein